MYPKPTQPVVLDDEYTNPFGSRALITASGTSTYGIELFKVEVPSRHQGYENELSLQIMIVQLSNKLSALTIELSQLKQGLENRTSTSSILIHDVGDERLELLKPLSVIIDESDEETLARCPELNSYGIGNTIFDSIVDLKKNIIDLFYDMSKREKKELGEFALHTLRTLSVYFKENDERP
jgi:hypothetical protein